MTAFYNRSTGNVWIVPGPDEDTVFLRKATSKMDAYDAIGETGDYLRRTDWAPSYGTVVQCNLDAA